MQSMLLYPRRSRFAPNLLKNRWKVALQSYFQPLKIMLELLYVNGHFLFAQIRLSDLRIVQQLYRIVFKGDGSRFQYVAPGCNLKSEICVLFNQ